jgi:cytochrome c-type biogenesis protein CcmH/NrfF
LATKRSRPYLLVAGSVVILLAAATVITFASSGITSLQEVSEGLTCQCGCGLTVANCNHPQCEFSVPVREQIETMIARGMGRAEIIGLFRAKYGEKILSAPTGEGFNLLAWIIPFAAVFAGCFIIVGAISRWRTHQVVQEGASASGRAPDDPELRKRLEQELGEQR